MAFAAALVAGACSGGSGADGARIERSTGQQAAATSGASPAAGGAVTGSIKVSGSSTVQPISTAVSEAFTAANPGFDLHGRGPRHRRRLQDVLRGRDRHQRRLAQDQATEEAATCQAERHRLHRAEDRLSTASPSSPRRANTAVTCLSFPDLYALIGPRVAPASRSGRTPQALAKELGSEHRLPGRAADDHRPRRGVRHLRLASSSSRSTRRSRDARRQDATTRPDYTASANDNAIIEGVAGTPTPRSAGWASPSPRRTRTRSRSSRSEGRQGPASRRPSTPSATAATRSPATCTSTSTRPRPPRTRQSSPSSTTTSPTGTIRRSSRPSRT